MQLFNRSIFTPFSGAALALLLITGCASRPEIRLDKDPSVDLHQYDTFAFFEPVSTDKSQYTTLLSGRLKNATRAELERRNYAYDEQNPDFRVNFNLDVVDRQEVRSTSMGPGFFGYRGLASDIDTVNYRQGTLSVDLVDASINQLVWQGIVEGRIDRKTLENPGPAVDKVVGEVFEAFPINQKGGDLASLAAAR
jgi:hypothetical protein